MENSGVGFIVFIVSFIVGRYLSESALKTLSENDQEKLIKGFSAYRIASLVGIAVLVVFHIATLSLAPDKSATTMPIFVGLFVIYLLGSTIYAYRKLKKLEIAEDYINKFLFSTLVQYVGLFIFFGIVINAK